MIDILEPDFIFNDARGQICQLANNGWSQINVITTHAGFRRGRMHYHAKNREAFYIVHGKVEYRCKCNQTGTIDSCMFKTGDFWSVDPNIGHDFYYIEDTILISLYSEGVIMPDGTKDIFEME